MSEETFLYPHATPRLQAYISFCETKPEEGQSAEWKKQREVLRSHVTQDELDDYHQAKTEWFCRDSNQVPDSEVTHTSPSEKYRLVVTRHPTGEGYMPYSKGKVYRGDTLLTSVCRNYSCFWFVWVEGHPQGDFLLCGEDYQGQTVIDLKSGVRKDYLPPEAKEGFGFCWIDVNPNPTGTLLAVSGCYWGAPYETLIVDFSHPLSPPWPVLRRDDNDIFAGWLDETTCLVGTRRELVNLPGHPLDGKNIDHCSLEEINTVTQYVEKHGIPGDNLGWKETLDTISIRTRS